jgi:hypothetical protein
MANVDVFLDVRNWANTDPSNGYKNTPPSSIGTTYSYKYSGGSDGNGGVTFAVGSGTSTITVTVGTDARYTIDPTQGVQFAGSDTSDLSWAMGPSPTVVVITDTDISDLDDEYKVVVRDSVANCTFVCDPPIKNVPQT